MRPDNVPYVFHYRLLKSAKSGDGNLEIDGPFLLAIPLYWGSAIRSKGAANGRAFVVLLVAGYFAPVCSSDCFSWRAACAAASLAVKRRKGEQET